MSKEHQGNVGGSLKPEAVDRNKTFVVQTGFTANSKKFVRQKPVQVTKCIGGGVCIGVCM